MLAGIFTNTEDVFQNQFVFLNDFIFGGIFIWITYSIVKYVADKYYTGTVYYKYLMNAYYVKVAASFMFMMIFAFYYKGGDTFAYLCNVLQLRDLLPNDPTATYNIMFRPNSFEAYYVMKDYMLAGGTYMTDPSTRIVINFAFFLSFLCFNSYFFMCLTCSMIAFAGCWKLFKVFTELYPQLHRQIAISCLFIPSVCFWSSGLLKDPLCVGALGIFTHSVYHVFIKRKSIFINMFVMAAMVYVLMSIKIYIILSFLPAMAMWIFSRYRYVIKSKFIKAIIGPVLLLVGIGLGALILNQMAKVAQKYSFEAMMRTAQDTQNWLVQSSQMTGGSFYTLGDIQYSFTGLLKIFPSAVNVAMFRPYIWEARKPILILASIEGMFTFYLTVRLLFRSGFINFFKMIADNPEVQFCLIFSIIFAFAVGFTSFNFGALARYKIPFMPFYYIALFILGDTQKKAQEQKIKI